MPVPFTETDIFQMYEKSGSRMADRMKNIITNPNACSIMNEALETSTLSRFGMTFKEPIALKALNAVRNGDLVLFIAKPEFNLPECIPFFRYTLKGKSKVGVNLTNICVTEGSGDDETYIVEDMRKLYAMLVGAYINLKIPDPADYPIKAIEHGAMMWANMFCKVLNRTIGLASNRERYEAYFYFAMRFFMINMIGVPAPSADAISKAALKSGEKSQLILMIEEAVEHQGLDMYHDITSFCGVLFNNDISNVKGLRMVAANPGEKLNVSFYVRRFVDTYNQSAIMALCNANYFTWLIICVIKKAYMANIKMMGDIVGNIDGTKYLAALFADAAN